jgi:predicted naringenin-chalcone synthase
MKAFIASLATANPKRCVTQDYAFEFINSHFSLQPEERDLYRRILLDGPIKTRYMAVDFDEQLCSTNPDELGARFLKQASALAIQAAQKAMAKTHLKPQDIGGLVVNTCTGYLCPGLSSYVTEALNLDKSVKVFDLMGMGCGAAVPNLQCASMMLPALSGKSVLSVAVEICSATIFMGPQPDLIVSNCIFGDGAAACVISAPKSPAHGLQLLDFETTVLPRYRQHLQYRCEQGRLRNVLSPRVPAIGAAAISDTVSRLLSRHKLTHKDIAFWAVHPGGTAVLDHICKKMNLPQDALACSYQTLEEYGNMSSPSVLFVLEKILHQPNLKKGQKGLLLSFGAGFTAHAALVQYR